MVTLSWVIWPAAAVETIAEPQVQNLAKFFAEGKKKLDIWSAILPKKKIWNASSPLLNVLCERQFAIHQISSLFVSLCFIEVSEVQLTSLFSTSLEMMCVSMCNDAKSNVSFSSKKCTKTISLSSSSIWSCIKKIAWFLRPAKWSKTNRVLP